MKKLLLILFFMSVVFNIGNIWAMPANPNPITTEQPDGTTITYYIKGDEKVHWSQSTDGYTLLRNDQQFLVYAAHDTAGDLILSEHVYRPETLRSATEKRFLSTIPKNLLFSEQQIQNKRAVWEKTQNLRNDSGEEIKKASVIGSKKALCVLVNFLDKTIGYPVVDFENLMNQEGYSENGAIGSVKDFYRQNSYGKMDLTVGVVGPYTLPNTAAWYGGDDNRWTGFAEAAIRAADADTAVDLSEYATNGKLETFHIIFAGYGDEAIDNGKQIWSHKSQFSSITLPKSGIKASVYSCSPELSGGSGTKMTTIGVVCHELCHVFGSDDYYDTDYTASGGNYPATGRWDLMADGSWNGPGRDGSQPAHINMFQKILYGWVVPDTLQTPLSVTNMPNSAENPVAYILKPATNNEQYVLENRQKIGFDAYVPGGGLLIYHIHNTAASGAINNRAHPQRAYVVCASAATKIPAAAVSSYGSINAAGAPFASTAARNEFSGTSTPQMFKWNGNSGIAVTDKPLRNITQTGGLISFCFGYLPVTNLQTVVDDTKIHLSWNVPDNASETMAYSYNIYVDNELVAGQITATNFDYQPGDLKTYSIAVEATDGDCHSARTAKVVPFHPALTFDLQGADGIFMTDQSYSVSVQVAGESASETITYDWSFDNDDLAEIIPNATNPARISLKTGLEEGSGILTAAVHYFTYPDTILQQEITIRRPEAITLTQLPAVRIVPNPVKDVLTLQVDTPVAVSITDINGRTVYRNTELSSLQLPVQHWDKGIYLVRIQSVAETKVIKLIKQ